MRFLLTITLFFFALQAHAQFLRVDIGNNQETVLSGETYVLASHATTFWDKTESSKEGTKNLIRFAHENQILVIGSVHLDALKFKETADQYYFSQEDVDYLVVSQAGQHLIHFENAEKIFFAGGNLTACLCEALRDVVRYNRSIYESRPLNLYLIYDAIYDLQPGKAPTTASGVDRFIKSYIIPSFHCPLQNWYKFPNLNLERVRLDTFLDGVPLLKYDLEPTDAVPLENLEYLIRVHFIHSKDLNKYK